MKKILTAIKPTGDWMHIGNYFWAFKPFLKQTKNKQAFVFIADLHSLTTVHDKKTLEHNKNRLLKEYFALLPDDTEIIVFEQSKIKKLNEISWILSSVTPYSMMLRAHAFKDSKNKNSNINMATFNYPILMTADILSYGIDIVPVWKDQTQHMEFARDIAGNFNQTYNTDLLILPEQLISKDTWIITGIDGQKMSKSYNNFIWIFDDEKIMKKKVMSIVTWSESLEDKKDPSKCNIFSLIKLFANQIKQDEIAEKYKAWWYWYWHAKLELLELILDYFKEARIKYNQFDNNMSQINKSLEKWNKIANDLADNTYKQMIDLVGLG